MLRILPILCGICSRNGMPSIANRFANANINVFIKGANAWRSHKYALTHSFFIELNHLLTTPRVIEFIEYRG